MVQRPLGLDPENPLVLTAVFGVEMQEFLRSPIGDFLLKRAETRLQSLLHDLKTMDATQSLKIAGLQAEIRHLEAFEGWLAEAVQAGLTAVAIIDGEIDAENA
jgi:hypothetical protein